MFEEVRFNVISFNISRIIHEGWWMDHHHHLEDRSNRVVLAGKSIIFTRPGEDLDKQNYGISGRQSHFLVSETLQPIKAQYNQYQRLFKRWNNRNVIASSPIPLNSNSFSKGYFLPSRFVLLLLLRFFSCSSFASFVRVQSCYKILYILFKFPTTPKCTLSSNEIRRWRCCNCWLFYLENIFLLWLTRLVLVKSPKIERMVIKLKLL